METSIFLAKLIGPMMLIAGLFVALNPARIKRIGREFLDSEALFFLSGILTLPVGLAIVVTHNIWQADWRVVITLFGWIAIVAGIARLAFPEFIKRIGQVMLDKTSMTALPGALMVILGGYLSYHGYLV